MPPPSLGSFLTHMCSHLFLLPDPPEWVFPPVALFSVALSCEFYCLSYARLTSLNESPLYPASIASICTTVYNLGAVTNKVKWLSSVTPTSEDFIHCHLTSDCKTIVLHILSYYFLVVSSWRINRIQITLALTQLYTFNINN